jgi:hypothetical protein
MTKKLAVFLLRATAVAFLDVRGDIESALASCWETSQLTASALCAREERHVRPQQNRRAQRLGGAEASRIGAVVHGLVTLTFTVTLHSVVIWK